MKPGVRNVISVMGLGKLGLPLAAAIAGSGFSVLGFDNNPSLILAIKEKNLSYEKGLVDLLERHQSRIQYSSDIQSVRAASLYFIVVPTPSTKNGDFSLEHVKHALETLASALKTKKDFSIISILSTV